MPEGLGFRVHAGMQGCAWLQGCAQDKVLALSSGQDCMLALWRRLPQQAAQRQTDKRAMSHTLQVHSRKHAEHEHLGMPRTG